MAWLNTDVMFVNIRKTNCQYTALRSLGGILFFYSLEMLLVKRDMLGI